MDEGESAREIEKDFDVTSVTAHGEKVWPILRWPYFYAIRHMTNAKPNRKSKFELLVDLFYGLPSWLGAADVLCFSDSEGSTRRLIQSEYYNRYIDPIIDFLLPEKCLLIEIPAPLHRPTKLTHTKRITSSTVIEAIARLQAAFNNKIQIENHEILDEIQRKYGITVDDEKILRLYHVKKGIYHSLYRYYKPKAIFFTEYYRDISRVKAAKELNIPTIEVQHGIIGTEHPAYRSLLKIDGDYYPDQLLTWGETEKKYDDETFFYKPHQVYPIGSYIIEYINNSYKPDDKLLQEISRYKKSAAVTLQKTVTEETIEFIQNAAKMNPSILYLLVPRQPLTTVTPLPENIRIIQNYNFYKLMKYVDVHVTAYSSCTLEAPSMGVRNILINIGGYAKTFYGPIMKDKTVTRYVETPSELVKEINQLGPIDKASIIKANSDLITPDYSSNLKKYLRGLKLLN
ncbi:TPA: hypothetical protein HA344_02190 [Candidatus Bathyarchaeota archaeon]|nr:hypothetical protein [Candidatus Bathyarchaeota archaeon]